jgi:hypothetical protein
VAARGPLARTATDGDRQLGQESDPAEIRVLKLLGAEAIQSAFLHALEARGTAALEHPARAAPHHHMHHERNALSMDGYPGTTRLDEMKQWLKQD